ncbi:hypothetical protein L7F22_014697 [Adiantum nelumboides]|nr:hypothetical protein [Adiantum nelumboides]
MRPLIDKNATYSRCSSYETQSRCLLNTCSVPRKQLSFPSSLPRVSLLNLSSSKLGTAAASSKTFLLDFDGGWSKCSHLAASSLSYPIQIAASNVDPNCSDGAFTKNKSTSQYAVSLEEVQLPPIPRVFSPLRDLVPRAFDKVILPNGLRVFLMEDHELGLVGGQLFVKAGSKNDPADKVGLATISSIVQRSGGTKQHRGDFLDVKLEVSGADVNKTQVNESGSQEDLELSKFLNQFQDVFIDDIPGELPPKRGDDDHAIELIPGSSPPNKPPYRVSQAQQEEIMRQVNELVEKGMVRDHHALFFFDRGARASFITPQLAKKTGIKTDALGPSYTASMAAPRHEVAVTPLVGKLRLHIQGYVGHEVFHIMPLEGCDVVSGMPWFYNHKSEAEHMEHLQAVVAMLRKENAARIESSSGVSEMSVGFRCLSEDLTEIMSLFSEVVQSPLMPINKLNLARTQLLGSIKRRGDNPGGIAAREFSKLLYGEKSAYSRYFSEDTLKCITRDDLVAFHTHTLSPTTSILGIWGDFDQERVRALISRTLGSWNDNRASSFHQAEQVGSVSQLEVGYSFLEPHIYVVNKPGLNQGFVRMGELGTTISDPDVFALDVLNDILNGFGGLLFNQVQKSKTSNSLSCFGSN